MRQATNACTFVDTDPSSVPSFERNGETQINSIIALTGITLETANSEFKGANALKKKINPTRVPIEEKESIRWLDNLKQSTSILGEAARCVHIGDRESDIYELFCMAQEAGTKFLLRTCVDRLAGDGEHMIAAEMAQIDCKGLH